MITKRLTSGSEILYIVNTVLNLTQEMKHTFVSTQTSIKKPSQLIGKFDATVAPIDQSWTGTRATSLPRSLKKYRSARGVENLILGIVWLKF